MAERHSSDTYYHLFTTFLKHTDEKVVLRKALQKMFFEYGVHSVLDIGAGNGELAIPLSQHVSRYVAIESNLKHVQALSQAPTITVLEGAFPEVTVMDYFDIVLCSHSAPFTSDRYTPFLTRAWTQVAPQGHLLLITYDDERGHWMDFRKECGLPIQHHERDRLTTLVRFLETLGSVHTEVITTFVRTTTVEDMVDALAFVQSDGDPERLEQFYAAGSVRPYLKRYYKEEDGYFFPFNHILLDVH